MIISLMLGVVAGVSAQKRLQDRDYRTSGYLNSDGRIQDSNYRTI